MVQAILLATVYVAITVPYRAAFNDNTTSTCSGLSPPHQNHYKSHINITASIIIATIMYRVFFSNGPTQKSSKYGIGPPQQEKMTKYTGPT